MLRPSREPPTSGFSDVFADDGGEDQGEGGTADTGEGAFEYTGPGGTAPPARGRRRSGSDDKHAKAAPAQAAFARLVQQVTARTTPGQRVAVGAALAILVVVGLWLATFNSTAHMRPADSAAGSGGVGSAEASYDAGAAGAGAAASGARRASSRTPARAASAPAIVPADGLELNAEEVRVCANSCDEVEGKHCWRLCKAYDKVR